MLVYTFLNFLFFVNLFLVYPKPYLYTDEDIIFYLSRVKFESLSSTAKPFNPVSLTSVSSPLPTDDYGPKQKQADLHVDQATKHSLFTCNLHLDGTQGKLLLYFNYFNYSLSYTLNLIFFIPPKNLRIC